MKNFQVEIVSAEEVLYSGPAVNLFASGTEGNLEVLANHAPLLTMLKPGAVWLRKPNGEEEAFVIVGGILEVQPNLSTILADSAIRAADLASEQEILAKQRDLTQDLQSLGVDYNKIKAELNLAAAELQVLRLLKKVLKDK